MPRSQTHGALRLSTLRLLSVASATAVSFGLLTTPASAIDEAVMVTPSSTFPERYSANIAGDLVLTGNTLLTCPASASSCAAAQAATSRTKLNNNDYSMVMVDVDDDPDTANSSSARITFPADAPIVFAGLYWGAGASGNQARGLPPSAAASVKLRTPGATNYIELTAATVNTISTTGANKTYSAVADITELVNTAGPGDYTVAGVAADLGTNHFAGWSLIAVYADATEPVRAISVFDGLVSVTGGSPATIDVDGFLTPPTGPVRTALGVVAYEGDLGITGDQLRLDGAALGDDVRSTSNFFNATVTSATGLISAKEPNYRNQLGFDTGIVDATGRIANNATSARFQASSTGDQYYPIALTFSTELFSPRYAAVKSGLDLNGDVLRAGDEIEYTLSLRNDVTIENGDASEGTVITDVLPAGATYVPDSLSIDGQPIADDAPTVDFSESTLTIRVGAGATEVSGGRLDIGEVVTVRYRMRVADSTAAGTVLRNDFTVAGSASTSGIPVTGRSNAVSLAVTADDADLSLTKSALNDGVAVAGRSATYEISVFNSGPGSADSVVVDDTLPAGVELISASGTGWACAAVESIVRCQRDSLAADSSAPVISVRVAIPGDEPTGSSVTNSAEVTSDTVDPDPTNNTDSATFTVRQQADLAITKTHDGQAITGETVTYVLAVRNAGPGDATGVTVTDALPQSLSLISVVGEGWTCNDEITCTHDSALPAGDAAEKILITARVEPTGTEVISNTATVVGDQDDPVPGNNTSTDISDRAQVIDVIESLSHPGRAIAGGPPIPELVRAYNVGPASVPAGSTVTQTITLPPGTSMAAVDDTQWTCVPATATATQSPVDITCSHILVDAWTPGTRLRDLTLPISVAAGETEDKTVTAVVSNDSGITDIDPENNRATDVITVEALADLAITTLDSAELIAGGVPRPLTFTVRNNGPSTNPGPLTVRFARIFDLEITADEDGPWTCDVAEELLQCTWAAGSLDPGASAPDLTLLVRSVDPAQRPATFALTGVVSSAIPDDNPDNNAATAPITLTARAQLISEKTASAATVFAGAPVTFTLSVTNTGPSVANDISLYDDLGDLGLAVTDVSSATATCAVEDGNVVNCTQDTLGVGETIDVVVTALTNSSWTTPQRVFRNTMDVTSSTPGDDPPAAFVDVTTNPYSTLNVEKTARGIGPGQSLEAGSAVIYDVVVTNSGPSDAIGVTVLDTLPSTLTPVVAVGDGWSCTISEGTITCATDSIVPVDTSLPPISIKATISATAQGSITNSVTATPTTPGESGTTSITHPVREVVDLDVAHFGPTLLESGDRWRTEVSVRNNGPADEPGPIRVVVRQDGGAEPIPPRVSGDGWQCSTDREKVECVTQSGLPFGATLPVITIISSTPEDGVQVNSRAAVSGTIEDIDRTNNRSQTAATLQRNADLALTKRATQRTVAAGGVVTYRLTVVNAGPGSAPDAQVRDSLPAGLTWLAKKSDPRCTAEETTVVCSVEGTLTPGQSDTFTIKARVGTDVRGTLINTARVSSSQPDNDPSNNRSRARVIVTPPTLPQVPLEEPPTRIIPNGTTVLYPEPLLTNAGQIATVSVHCRPIVDRVSRGDFHYCTLYRRPDGSLVLTTRGNLPLRVTLTVRAPATTGYDRMLIRYRYRVD